MQVTQKRHGKMAFAIRPCRLDIPSKGLVLAVQALWTNIGYITSR